MSEPQYHKADEDALGPGSRAVVPWNKGVVFRCPCDERQCYISSEIHQIAFDEEGVLTLSPSVGYHAKPDMDPPRPQNWCHFFLKNGRAEMCSDAQCPGKAKK